MSTNPSHSNSPPFFNNCNRITDILTSIGLHTSPENHQNCITLAIIYANFDAILIHVPLHLRPRIVESIDSAMGMLQGNLKISNEHARMIYDATFKDIDDILNSRCSSSKS